MKTNSAVSSRRNAAWMAVALIFSCASCGKDKDNDKPGPDPVNNKMEITSFSPGHGAPGTEVTINGKNFKPGVLQNEVRFNGAALGAFIKDATAEQLTVQVPADATTGKIIVKTGNQADTTATDFTVDPLQTTITGFTPKQGPFGTEVTITGTKFSNDIIVRINDITATLVSRSATRIVFTIPVNTTLTSHKIIVTSGADVLQTANNFTVTATGPYASWQKKNITFVPEGASVFTSGLSFVYKNKIYWGFTGISTFETEADYVVFDPAQPANGWVLQNHPPAAMATAKWKNATALVHNNRVFMGTGFTSTATSKQWWEFFPETNTANRLTDYPEPTADALSFIVNNHLYTGFGATSKKLYQFNPAGNNNLGSWDLAATGTFSELNTGNAFVINNEVILGRVLPAINQTRKAIYKFTEPDQLTRLADMPDELTSLQTPAFTIGNKGYFIIQKNVWEYTPAAGGSWRAVIARTDGPVLNHAAVVTVNGVPVVYGWTSSGSLYEFKL